MSALEQPFIDAIAARQIEGAILEGRNVSGKRYGNAIGNRTLPDGSEKPLSTKDILFLASATKLVTAIAVLQCCEKGQLSLDADLRPKLPKLVEQGVLLSYDDSPVIEPVRNTLTLRHLLTHSSGLVYDFIHPTMKKWRTENAEDGGPDVPSRMTQPLAFQPGEGWMYGVGLDWAGYLVEQVTDMRLDEYFRTHILKPLGVSPTDLSFFPVKEGLGDRMPDLSPSDPRGEGLSAGMGQSVHGDSMKACFGGQGAYASLEAYIAVLHSILLNDGKILSVESVNEMHKPQLESGAKESFHSILEGPMGGIMSQGVTGHNRDYGLSGILAGDGDETLGKGSLVWGGGINTGWLIDRVNGVCGIVSPQLGLPPDMATGMKLKKLFRKELKGQLEQ